jgi:hypothetical protein
MLHRRPDLRHPTRSAARINRQLQGKKQANLQDTERQRLEPILSENDPNWPHPEVCQWRSEQELESYSHDQ